MISFEASVVYISPVRVDVKDKYNFTYSCKSREMANKLQLGQKVIAYEVDEFEVNLAVQKNDA